MRTVFLRVLCLCGALALPSAAAAQFVGITGTGAGINYENYGTLTTALDEVRPFESGNTTVTVNQDIFVSGFGGGVDLDQARLYYKTNSATVGTINDGSWTVVNGTISALGGNDDRATFNITGVAPGTDIMFYIRYTEAGVDYYGFSGTASPHTAQPSTQAQLYKIRFNAATTPNTQRIDGLTHEWNSTTQLAGRSTTTPGRTLDITWDSDYIYLLLNGGFTASAFDRLHIAFDLDPGTTNGATFDYNGAQFPDRYRPDVVYRALGDGSNVWRTERAAASGSAWGSTNLVPTSEMTAAAGSNTANLEVRILRSAIGSFTSLGIFVWLGNGSGFLYDAFPYGNPSTSGVLPIQFGYATLGSGVTTATADYLDAQYTTGTTFDLFGSTVYRDLRISGSGAVGVDVAGVATITSDLVVNGTLTIDAGATFRMRDFTNSSDAPATVDLNLNGDLVQNGTLTLSGASGADLFIAGNWSGTGTFADNGRQTTFDGNANQTLVGGKTFSFLRTNKSGGELQLSGDATVTADLTLTAGNINLQNATLTLGSASALGALALGANRVYGGNFRRFVNGETSALSLPAFSGSDDRTVTLTFAPGNAMGTFVTVTNLDYRTSIIHPGLENTNFASGGLPAAGINDPMKIAPFLWDITSNATATYTISLQGTGLTPVADPNLLRILRRANASAGYTLAGTHVSGSGAGGNYTVSASGLTGFSEFTLGNGGPELLPVAWLEVSARRVAAGAEVAWVTATETNNERFEVERASTADFRQFSVVGTLPGAGTTQQARSYRLVDAELGLGPQFYRIRQVDLDGRSSRSPVVRLAEGGPGPARVLVFPTLTHGDDLQLVALEGAPPAGAPLVARLVGAQGQLLWQGQGPLAAVHAGCRAALLAAAPGLWVLQLSGPGLQQHSRLVRP